ncbi:hypothetical protein [Halanaerobacter jeridensis]|uniref:Uncharacterized protein n=1 Tax=Halanaerobacter jeridensis TaxID=706427 RepID=A0A938XSZ6_9FIRM|nr:hypothetical protein [Halanaerobacter jeridensis]MBM7556309.1 hypothetical protein [Halanaerobacter jeridensis]
MNDVHKKPTPFQKNIAIKLEVDISNDTRNVASARIYDAVEPAIDPNMEFNESTEKQIEFGEELGLDLKNNSLRVASAKIEDKLKENNKQAIEELNLKPGDKVKKKSKVEIDGEEKKYITKHVVSSIGKNYRVYFKGGNGQGAWPTQLEKVNL